MLKKLKNAADTSHSDVRTEVLSQHDTLRTILREAQVAALEGHAHPLEVAHLAHEIRRSFRAHLAFEERVLVPVLTSVEVWGPDRVRNLVEEHTRQRADLDALIASIESGEDTARVASMFCRIAADLAQDMDEEERDYLGPDLLRDYAAFPDRG
jgi:hypothetical protein